MKALVLLSLICVCYGNYDDGTLNVGDTYGDDVQFSRHSYTIYQLPYGIDYKAMTFSGKDIPNGNGLFLMDHSRCPGGTHCVDGGQQILVEIKMSNLQIMAIKPFNKTVYGSALTQRYFPLIDGNYTYLLTDSMLSKYDYPRGKVVSSFEGDFNCGVLNPAQTTAFLLGNDNVQKVNLADMSDEGNILPPNGTVLTRGTPMAMDSNSKLYLPLRNAVSNWTVYQMDSSSGTVEKEVKLHISDPLSLAQFVLVDSSNVIWVGFSQNSNNSWNDQITSRPWVLFKLNFNLNVTSVESVEFSMSDYTSSVFRTSHNELYLGTKGGELVKFSDISYQGKETFQTQYVASKDCPFAPGIYPAIQSMALFDDNTLYAGSSWWGSLVHANLKEFTAGCFVQPQTITETVTFLVLVTVLPILGCCILVGVVIFVVVRRRWHHHHYEEIH